MSDVGVVSGRGRAEGECGPREGFGSVGVFGDVWKSVEVGAGERLGEGGVGDAWNGEGRAWMVLEGTEKGVEVGIGRGGGTGGNV